MENIERIRGGWAKVPEHLKCKSDLNKLGLRPGGGPVAEVWNSYQWILLYDINEAVPKKTPTKKQLKALAKGREKLKEMLTCSQCGDYVHLKKNMKGNICGYCYRSNQLQIFRTRKPTQVENRL